MRRWKLSPMDLESITRWEDYSRAKDEMFVHTDIPEAPWYVVESDDKRRARINMIAHLLSTVPYTSVPAATGTARAAAVHRLPAPAARDADLRARPRRHARIARCSPAAPRGAGGGCGRGPGALVLGPASGQRCGQVALQRRADQRDHLLGRQRGQRLDLDDVARHHHADDLRAASDARSSGPSDAEPRPRSWRAPRG